MNSRTLIIIGVLAILYFLWSRKKAGTIAARGEWNTYTPTEFRVIEGGASIVPEDDK